jgi:hypothetical protein
VSEPSARAELIEDRGAAAAGEEFFRSRPFLDAEGVTHTLRIEVGGGELLAPLIVRGIEGTDERDAISPYGYPGLVERSRGGGGGGGRRGGGGGGGPPPPPPRGAPPPPPPPTPPALDPESIDFSATGLVTIFLRHTLGDPPLGATSERNVVQIADPALPAKSRGSDRNQINKNLRNGYELSLFPGPEASAEQRAGFLSAYEQTMRRTGAAERYFFGAAYFDRILELTRTWLALAHAPDGTIAAASIAASSDGYLHYYLSGSADSHLRDSPMKNIVASLIELAAELGEPLNLGGGITRGDRLEEFKRGFANRELPWCSSELVTDPSAYAQLSAGHAADGFFPAYRA